MAGEPQVEYPSGCGPISPDANTNELIKKLKVLAEALENHEQNDQKNPMRLGSLASHLTNQKFMNNISKDVQILLACCLADIYRIFAPETPYGDPEIMKSTLLYIVRSLKGLDNPSSPSYHRYHYLLENIHLTKTLELCTELPGEEPQLIIRQLIKTSLEIATKIKIVKPHKVERSDSGHDSASGYGEELDDEEEEEDNGMKILNILCEIIRNLLREVNQITPLILDALFFYIINPQKLNCKQSYHMARQLIQISQTNLEASIQSLLTTSLLVGEFPKECELVGQAKPKLHEVIYELHEIAPELIYPILPHFQNVLNSEDLNDRLMGTKLIGNLCLNPKSRLSEEQPAIWDAYLRRFVDINDEIRCVCARNACEILLNHPSLRGAVSERLIRLVLDREESVRIVAVQSVGSVAKRKLEAISEQLITACAERIFDKKSKVRMEATKHMLLIHQKVFKEDGYTASDRSSIQIIVKKAMMLYTTPEVQEEKTLIERHFVLSIVPYKLPAEKRMATMLEVFLGLSTKEIAAFTELIMRQSTVRRALLEILNLVSTQGGSEDPQVVETLKKEVEKRIERIANGNADPHKLVTALRLFTNYVSNDQRAFELVEYMVGPRYTTAKVEENFRELLTRMVEKRGDERMLTDEQAYLIKMMMERSMPLQIDAEAAKELTMAVLRTVRRVECGEPTHTMRLPNTLLLWKIVAENYPHCFAIDEVAREVIGLARRLACPPAVETAMRILWMVSVQSSVKAVEQLWIKDALACAEEVAREGSGRGAKLAVRFMCRILGREDGREILLKLAEDSLKQLSIDNPRCISAMQAIGQIVRAYPNEIRDQLKEVMSDIIVPHIMLSQDRSNDEPALFDGIAPLDKEKMPIYIKTKIYAMKMLARYLDAVNSDEYDMPLAEKTVKLFTSIILERGDLHAGEMSECERAWMRAVAGTCLLRLACSSNYSKLITVQKLRILAQLLMDDMDCVRQHVIKRLKIALFRGRVGIEYAGMFALVPLVKEEDDPDRQRLYHNLGKFLLEQVIFRAYQTVKSNHIKEGLLSYYQPELVVAYAIYFLSHAESYHHYDDEDTLVELREGLWFVLDIFINKKDKFDLDTIHSLLLMVKESTDASDEDATKEEKISQCKKMWALTDLAIAMLIYRSKKQIQSRPTKLLLSRRYFAQMKTKSGNNKLFAPARLIEEEKTGKVRAANKKKLNGTSKRENTTIRSRGGGTNRRGGRAPRGGSPIMEESDGGESHVSEDDEAEEVMPKKKIRVANAATSKGTPKRRFSKKEVSSDKEDLDEEMNVDQDAGPSTSTAKRPLKRVAAVEDPGFSPIVGSKSRVASLRRSVGGPQASSTPLRTNESSGGAGAVAKRKAEAPVVPEIEEPKAKRGRPSKTSPQKKAPEANNVEKTVTGELIDEDWEEPVLPKRQSRGAVKSTPKQSPLKSPPPKVKSSPQKTSPKALKAKENKESEKTQIAVRGGKGRGRGRGRVSTNNAKREKESPQKESSESESDEEILADVQKRATRGRASRSQPSSPKKETVKSTRKSAKVEEDKTQKSASPVKKSEQSNKRGGRGGTKTVVRGRGRGRR